MNRGDSKATLTIGEGCLSDGSSSLKRGETPDGPIQLYAQSVPLMFRRLFVKASNRAVSPLQAIKANCQACVGYEDAINRIRECSILRCPLNRYRPYQNRMDA